MGLIIITNYEKQFVQIIRCAISNKSLPDMIDWDKIWVLACDHHLEALIYDTIHSSPAISNKIPYAISEKMHQKQAKPHWPDTV